MIYHEYVFTNNTKMKTLYFLLYEKNIIKNFIYLTN